jgi:hypothetical protein
MPTVFSAICLLSKFQHIIIEMELDEKLRFSWSQHFFLLVQSRHTPSSEVGASVPLEDLDLPLQDEILVVIGST